MIEWKYCVAILPFVLVMPYDVYYVVCCWWCNPWITIYYNVMYFYTVSNLGEKNCKHKCAAPRSIIIVIVRSLPFSSFFRTHHHQQRRLVFFPFYIQSSSSWSPCVYHTCFMLLYRYFYCWEGEKNKGSWTM